MIRRLLRFADLQALGLVASWPQLRNLQRDTGFPAGRMIGVNTRAWDEAEVEAWIASRPVEGPAPRGIAKAKAAKRKGTTKESAATANA
jgi:predicted DNA-binding transcriptional regulator AlpA